jgi:putative SOS response-associated peptidase YedK
MCRWYVLASELGRIETRFNVRIRYPSDEISKGYGVSCNDFAYVITSNEPFVLQTFRFGMTPFFAKEAMNIINARSEGDKSSRNDPEYNGSKSIFLKTAFMKPMQTQRCLVIADAYYEWFDKKSHTWFFFNIATAPSILNSTGERLLPETVPVRLSSGYRTHKEKHPANAPTFRKECQKQSEKFHDDRS